MLLNCFHLLILSMFHLAVVFAYHVSEPRTSKFLTNILSCRFISSDLECIHDGKLST
jgi:hypothetical protein